LITYSIQGEAEKLGHWLPSQKGARYFTG